MRKLGLLILIGLVLAGSFHNEAWAFQGLPGDNECRIYAEEASEQALDELNQQQALHIRFRSRQMSENVPQRYIDQTQAIITDYKRAIELTQSALDNEISQTAWRKALTPLQLSPACSAGSDSATRQNEAVGQKFIGFLLILIVIGGSVVVVIYRRQAANNSSR